MTNDEPGVPNTDPETIDPAGHMADLIESGAVDMELAADADRLLDEMREFLDRVDAGEYDVDPGLEATVRIVRSLLDGDDDTGE
jgi:vacuolar-type H+-ATPase subunit D/Vma8